MKTYTYELSEKDLQKLRVKLAQAHQLLNDESLYKFLGNKCLEELHKICVENLTSYGEEDIDTSYYMSCNKFEIIEGGIYIYNDSEISIASKNMSSEKRSNYPSTLSLAKMVEFGIGYTGSLTDQTEVEDWEYDVNQHGYKGWYYTDNQGVTHWTNGYRGRLIFAKLKQRVIDNLENWVTEYVYSII